MSTETVIRTAAEIRQDFLDYFKKGLAHTVVPSAPVVPHDDPTLMFTNAGMNQFKDVFLGLGDRPYTRAVDTQKCIRAGGKHNDLEDVGTDTYHHTFFEMLGNWSFGDYFKLEAIEWAWKLLTEVWGLDPDRLYLTVFEGDAADGTGADLEAEGYWRQFADPSRISRWGKKDNFWEMGETGPCGPCSEIHYDSRPDDQRALVPGSELVNQDHPDVIEVWNLVFVQYNRVDGGALQPLPDKHVDTGMGFERIVRVLQGKRSNYDTDIWTPIFDAIHARTGVRRYAGGMDDHIDIAYRVIADHLRCLTVAITDGARPGNEGRGYVLRRILRRAVRHAHQTLGVHEPVLHDIVPAVVESLVDAFPELRESAALVQRIIREEELSFLRTLDQGMKLWWGAAASALIAQSMSEHEDTAVAKPCWLGLRGRLPAGQSSDWRVQENAAPVDENTLLVIRDGTSWNDFTSERTVPFYDLTAEDIAQLTVAPPPISGDHAFRLHDTFGFPIDLTLVMARERGLTVDLKGYELLMAQARERSQSGATSENSITLPPDALAQLRHLNIEPTGDDDKFPGRPITATVEAIWNGTDFDNFASVGDPIVLILNRTNFYADKGGQIGDTGRIESGTFDGGSVPQVAYGGAGGVAGGRQSNRQGRFKVEDTQVVGGYVLHIGRVIEDKISVDDRVQLTIDRDRRQAIRSNHTATHLLNLALHEVVGEEEDQKGSMVGPEKLRFDYACAKALTAEQIDTVQRIVNEQVAQNLPVHAGELPLDLAQQINGVRAIFGERYPDPVRVVSIGPSIQELSENPQDARWADHSIEFCGGTHLDSTGDIGRLVIASEQGLASGVRRVIALTGMPAMAANVAGMELLERIEQADSLDGDDLVAEFDEIGRLIEELTIGVVARHRVQERLEKLHARVKTVRKAARAEGRAAAVDQARAIAEDHTGPIIVRRIDDADKETLLAAMDVIRAKHPETAAMLITADEVESKVFIAARVPDSLIAKGLKAGDWVREAARICGGGGGGRPDMAQAGGKDPSKVDDAITDSIRFARVIVE